MRSFIFLLLASASTTLAWSPLFERAPSGCLADNCLRAITGTEAGQIQTRSDRPGDCSSFLGALGVVQTVTPSTVTVTTTASFVASSTSSVFTTLASTITSLTTLTSTATSVSTTITTSQNKNVKRDAPTFPAYASPCSSAARYSSGCACAGVTASITTLPTPTFTLTISATSTIIIDITSTIFSLSVATSTVIDVAATAISTATIISAVAPAVPACTPWSNFGNPIPGNMQYEYNVNQFFAGVGVSMNSDNPAADGISPISTTFAGTNTACQTLTSCYEWAMAGQSYLTFEFHYGISENVWYCVAYKGSGSSAAYFNVESTDIGLSYGYVGNVELI